MIIRLLRLLINGPKLDIGLRDIRYVRPFVNLLGKRLISKTNKSNCT